MVAFFDKLAPDWDNAPQEYETREKLVSMMELEPNSIITDVGCGRGVMLPHLLKSNPAKIIALDISGEMIRLAKESFTDNRIEFINGDLYTEVLPPVDAVVFFNSYPHFIDKITLSKKLAEIIKENGKLIIAHSLSKAEINGFHTGESVSKISVRLEEAEVEAAKFKEHFSVDTTVDDDELYFIKLTRR